MEKFDCKWKSLENAKLEGAVWTLLAGKSVENREPGGFNFGNTVVKRESVKIIQSVQKAAKSVSGNPA